MRPSLNNILFGVSILSALLLLLSNTMGALAVAQLASDLQDMETTSNSLHNHMQVDMMHDAIRADVNAALLSSSGITSIREVRDEFTRHTGELRRRIKANARLPINGETREALKAVTAPLDEYMQSADDIIRQIETGQQPNRQTLTAFKARFTALEGGMERVSEKVEQQVSLTSSTGEANAAALKEVLSASTALSVGLFVLAGLFQSRSGARLFTAVSTFGANLLASVHSMWRKIWNVVV